MVIWDVLGLVRASISEQNSLSRLIAEVEDMAAVRALVFDKVVGVYLVILEGDSKIIINALMDEADSFASYSHLIVDTKILA